MLLMATVDDVSAETVPYIIERVISAGADNMHVVSAITKKNRMEYIVFVDVSKEKLDASLYAAGARVRHDRRQGDRV